MPNRKPTSSTAPLPTRANILNTARDLTLGERNRTYGNAYDNMKNLARLWNAYLNGKYHLAIYLTAEDASWMYVMGKISRTYSGALHLDNHIDAAAFAAIAGECAETEANRVFNTNKD